MTQPSAAGLSGILEERGAAHPLSIIEVEDVRLDGTIIIETAYLNGLSAVICGRSIIAQRELLQGKRRGHSAPALTLHKKTPPQSAPRRPTGSRHQEEAGAPLHGVPSCERLPSSARPANTVHFNDMSPEREARLAGYFGELVQHVGWDAFLNGSAAVTDRQDLGVLLAIALASDAGVR